MIDPGLAAWLDDLRAGAGPPARELGATALRAGARRRAAARPRGPDLAAVEPVAVPGAPALAARRYRPAPTARPLVVFLHGGMWVLGDLETHDRTCRRLALAADVDVLAVDLRRAPEAPWPAAVDDALRALRWAGSEAPVAVAGDSSGAHLATLACLRLRDEGGPLPAGQALAYPNTDLTLSRPSIRSKGAGWGLDPADLAWAVGQWGIAPERRADPAVSPLFAPDLAGLPPALVVTAEHDPLRDEGDEYVARLRDAGTPVLHRCEPDLVHGFLQGLDTISPIAADAADRFFADVGRLARGALVASATGEPPMGGLDF